MDKLKKEVKQTIMPGLDKIITIIERTHRIPYEYEVDTILNPYHEKLNETLLENIHDFYLETSNISESRIQQQEVEAQIVGKINEQLLKQYITRKADFQSNLDFFLFRRARNITNTVQTRLDKWIRNPVRQLTNLIRTEGELFEFDVDHAVINYMENNVFTASESTMQRVTQEVYDILREHMGVEGDGIDEVTQVIQERFTELADYEAQRIARTETLKAQGHANYQRLLNNDSVEYKMWMATDDDRTRESHLELNGQITYKTEPFGNGLYYDGDTSGAIEEWINCRCDTVAYYPEVEYVPPPDEPYWYEEDWQVNPFFQDVLPEDIGFEVTVEY